MAVDKSPGAVAVSRERGVRDVRCADLTNPPTDRRWATILLMCGNLGLAGGWSDTRALLSNLAELAQPGAVLVGDTVDPTVTHDADYHRYMQAMAAKNLPRGLVQLRFRLGDRVTPWWRLLNVPAEDIPVLVSGTGWNLERHINEGIDQAIKLRRGPKPPPPGYAGQLEPAGARREG